MLFRLGLFAVLALALVAIASTHARAENKFPDDLRAELEKGGGFQLLSLDPDIEQDEKKGLHGWKVLGSTVVKEAATREKLVAALKQGVDENKKGDGYLCFDPRHAIRLVNGKTTTDILICFHCMQVEYYIGGEKEPKSFLLSRSPQKVFDAVLTAAKVPLPKPPKDEEEKAKPEKK